MAFRDDRYPRARTPAADQGGHFFPTGQGGRPLLPPIDSAFPTSHFPAPGTHYSQQRQYHQPYNHQWNNAPMAAPQPAFPYYEDASRYSSQQAYSAMYVPRSATAAPGHPSDARRPPPLSTTPTPGRDERWAAYPTPGFNGAPSGNNIRSPTASYPASYTTAYPSTSGYGYDPRCVSGLNPQFMPGDARAGSPYGRNSSHPSPPTPPPVSPVSGDEPTVKKKRKRADAQQLRVLNETYARTAFPSTEERLALAKALDMSPRSVQIWFQNKRQSMRQTNRQSSTPHQSFSMPSDEALLEEMETTSPMPPTSHRRMRSQEDVIVDPRKYSSRGY